MNKLEDRLRDAFRADADTVRPDSLRPLPARGSQRGPRWRALLVSRGRPRGRVLIPLAAATAVAVIAVAAVVIVPALLSGRQPHTVPRIPLTAGWPGDKLTAGPAPRFFVAAVYPRGSNTLTLEVVSAATGRVTGRLPAPEAHRSFEAVAVLGNNRTFVAAAVGTRCDTWFYRFGLTAQGKPVGLRPLSIGLPEVPGRLVSPSSLAVSADGRFLAYATQGCAGFYSHRYLGQIGVVKLATSAVPTLTGPSVTTVTTWLFRPPAQPSSLSLSANGRLLAFISNPSNGQRGFSEDFNRVWVLRTDSPGGLLARHYRKLVGPYTKVDGLPSYPTGAVLTPTGAVTLVVQPTYHRATHWHGSLGAYQTATGRLIRRWHQFPRLGELTDEPTLVADASGTRYLIYSWTQQPERLDLTTGRLVKVPGHLVSYPLDVAW